MFKNKRVDFFKQREKNVKAALNEDANCCIFELIDFFYSFGVVCHR